MGWEYKLLGVGIVGGLAYLALKNAPAIGAWTGAQLGAGLSGLFGGITTATTPQNTGLTTSALAGDTSVKYPTTAGDLTDFVNKIIAAGGSVSPALQPTTTTSTSNNSNPTIFTIQPTATTPIGTQLSGATAPASGGLLPRGTSTFMGRYGPITFS